MKRDKWRKRARKDQKLFIVFISVNWNVRLFDFKKYKIKTTNQMLKTYYHTIKITYHQKEWKCKHNQRICPKFIILTQNP